MSPAGRPTVPRLVWWERCSPTANSPRPPRRLHEGQWLGVKVVSFLVEGGRGTRNLLYLDTEPFGADGRPRNNFRLFSDWTDRDGEKTGLYENAAIWAGWETTFRVDGWHNVDFTHLSVREVVPPAA